MFDRIDRSNARVTRNKLFQLDDAQYNLSRIAETLVLGPETIEVCVTPGDCDGYYHGPNSRDLSFRFSARGSKSLRSWAIYGDIYAESCVLRSANWSLENKQAGIEDRIVSTIRFVGIDYCERLYPQWDSLRVLLAASLLPEAIHQTSQNTLPSSDWERCELFLQLARGIEIRWLNTSRNDKLSETALALAVKIEQVLAKHETNEPESIEALEMMYSKIPPEALPLFQK